MERCAGAGFYVFDKLKVLTYGAAPILAGWSGKRVLVCYRLALLLVLGLSLPGCVKSYSYVLPVLPHMTYGDLLVAREPRPVVLTVEFQINGVIEPKAGAPFRERVSRILGTAHVFSLLGAGPAQNTDTLEIVLNNVGDVGDIVGSAVLTGLTFGASGSTVTDGFVMTATFTRVAQPPLVRVYKHAVLSTIGNARGPVSLTPMGTTEAVDQVLQDLVLT